MPLEQLCWLLRAAAHLLADPGEGEAPLPPVPVAAAAAAAAAAGRPDAAAALAAAVMDAAALCLDPAARPVLSPRCAHGPDRCLVECGRAPTRRVGGARRSDPPRRAARRRDRIDAWRVDAGAADVALPPGIMLSPCHSAALPKRHWVLRLTIPLPARLVRATA